ncbi:hypothetical protein [Leadbetterella byssophila]|uniref:hypothetical protein n=1 Tax=Leadbetterella byssophila TaxID=316068 RepID=UPI0039A1FC0F
MNKCDCPDGIFENDLERFKRTSLLELPFNKERERRLKNGLTSTVTIDTCIVEEIEYLWSLGIVTLGCCCGHNKTQSMVNVADENIQDMLDMGYIQNHPDPSRKDTFRLKSAG